MEREQLFGKVIDSEVRKQRKLDKKEAEQTKKRTEKYRIREEHLKPFRELDTRNLNVAKAVEGMTKDVDEKWSFGAGGEDMRSKGIVVILGAAPKTEATPQHTGVCIVRKTRYNSMTNRSNWAQFEFAVVPDNSIESIVKSNSGNPLANIGPEVIRRTESTKPGGKIVTTGEEVDYTGGLGNHIRYRKKLNEVRDEVVSLEQTLQWITEAAANAELNPHLQPHEPVSLEKQQTMGV